MTDKEHIIINGVDVSGCNGYCPELGKYNCIALACNSAAICKQSPNCYYKQLQRRIAECEELKNQVDEDYNYYTTELKTLRDIISNKEKRNAALFLMSNRYRKALEEIEKYTREQFCDNCEDIGSTEYNCHCEYCEYQEYFDIIAKAKDGK